MYGHSSIVEAVGFSGPSFRGRPTRFTPERIQQIKNLVERGKSREDIAELVGVTVGSLAVACSKLGISLRRRMINNGVRLPRPRTRVSDGGSTASLQGCMAASQSEQQVAASTLEHEIGAGEAGTPSQDRSQAEKIASAEFAIRMDYKGVECTAELALTADMITHLALEAEFRNLRIGDLIRDIILSTVKNDLFREVYAA
jgi:hypothetical protein